jgi:hypothetical protein
MGESDPCSRQLRIPVPVFYGLKGQCHEMVIEDKAVEY